MTTRSASLISTIALGLLHMMVHAQIELRYEQNQTLSYDEVIAAYNYLDEKYDQAQLFNIGPTDIGRPLNLFVLSQDGDFDPVSIHERNKTVVFILNGIHPGEPPGVDACIEFSENVLSGYQGMDRYLEHAVVCIVPVYNIGGHMNRSPFNRANQDTPQETGFRGNARNLDLNRDFIKLDSKNARSLVNAIQEWEPEVFLDTHVTNGSDHQYTITLIPTVHQRLPDPMARYFKDEMVPALFQAMKSSPYEMIPYVNWVTRDPSNGIGAYFDAPRVSSGYASLFNIYSFMTENHVYKDFRDQVKSVYYFIDALVDFANQHADEIIETKRQGDAAVAGLDQFISAWEPDTTQFDLLEFKGYEMVRKTSALTGGQSMYYDKERPYTRTIPYYQYFQASGTITRPTSYIIPQAWDRAIERLKLNGVQMRPLNSDTTLEVESYYIEDVRHSDRPYNGHFRNSRIRVRKELQTIQFHKGDYVVVLNQPRNRFIMEVLEPTTEDSYLSWNFFDPIFDRREYFSPYGFEKKAFQYLEEHPDLRAAFMKKKMEDEAFATNHYAQLQFIYSNSPFMEKSYMRHPVYRYMGGLDWILEKK